MKLGPTAHRDSFPRDRLPAADDCPDFLLEGFSYPDYLNAAVALTDAMVEKGFGDRFIHTLPKTQTGKVQRFRLRDF